MRLWHNKKTKKPQVLLDVIASWSGSVCNENGGNLYLHSSTFFLFNVGEMWFADY